MTTTAQNDELRRMRASLCMLRGQKTCRARVTRLHTKIASLEREIEEIESGSRVREFDTNADKALKRFYSVREGSIARAARSSSSRALYTSTYRVMPRGTRSKTRDGHARGLNPVTKVDR